MIPTAEDQLRQAREARGLSLDQIALSTHIRRAYLEAIERGDRAALPSAVQARGFVRLYASTVGLDAKDIVDLWEGRLPAPPPPSPARSTPVVASLPTEPQQPAEARPPLDEPDPAPLEDATDPILDLDSQIPPEPVSFDEPRLASPSDSDLPVSRQILASLGADLKKQREALGISYTDVARYTRMRQHYIISMEEGRFEELPSPVQARGMLNNYTAFLNLNSEAYLLRYADALQKRRLESLPSRQPRPTARPGGVKNAGQRLISPDLLLGVLLVVVVGGFVIWGVAQVNTFSKGALEPTAPSISDVLAVTQTGSPGPTLAATATPEFTNLLAEGEIEQPSGPSESSEDPNATLAPLSDAPLQVYVIARQRAWMRVIVDNKVAFEGRVTPGTAYPFSGAVEINLLTGNGAALQVFFNQDDLGVIGLTGQVVGMLFNQNGAMTPTPAFVPEETTPQATSGPNSPGSQPGAATPTITPLVPTP